MIRKLVDLLKEVFWIKTSRKKPKIYRRKTSSATKHGGSASGGKKSPVKKKMAKAVKKPLVEKKSLLKGTVPLKSREQSPSIDPSLQIAGVITHYFDRIKVCVVKITKGSILIGDKLTILGPKTKFVQKVWSLQIESVDVKVAKKGQIIGLKVDKLVAVGDKVYK